MSVDIDKRIIRGCPKCGYAFIYRQDDVLKCLSPKPCDYSIKAKRAGDIEIMTIKDIKREWV